jgi:hypothetical protein
MSYIGAKPAEQILSSADIQDGAISTVDLANGSITAAKMASAGAWGPAGTVIQVVQGTYSTQVITSSTSLVDTGLTASITPKFSTSKILVMISQAGLNLQTATTGINLQLIRGSTSIYSFGKYTLYTSATNMNGGISGCYLDSPATTSSTTYKTQFLRQDGSGSVQAQGFSDTSTITLMEIAQ